MAKRRDDKPARAKNTRQPAPRGRGERAPLHARRRPTDRTQNAEPAAEAQPADVAPQAPLAPAPRGEGRSRSGGNRHALEIKPKEYEGRDGAETGADKNQRLPYNRPAPNTPSPIERGPERTPNPRRGRSPGNELRERGKHFFDGQQVEAAPIPGGGQRPRGTKKRAATGRPSTPEAAGSSDARLVETYLLRQLELLTRIDENLRRLRELVEARDPTLAVFTEPAF